MVGEKGAITNVLVTKNSRDYDTVVTPADCSVWVKLENIIIQSSAVAIGFSR